MAFNRHPIQRGRTILVGVRVEVTVVEKASTDLCPCLLTQPQYTSLSNEADLSTGELDYASHLPNLCNDEHYSHCLNGRDCNESRSL